MAAWNTRGLHLVLLILCWFCQKSFPLKLLQWGRYIAHAVTGSKSRPGFDRFSLGEMKGRKRSPGDAVIISQLPESYGHMAPDFQLPAGSRGSFSRV